MQHWQSTSIYYSTTHECILTLAPLGQKVNVHMCMCAHMHKGWKFSGVKLLQMLILRVRKLRTLSLLSCHWETLMCFHDGCVLGDTNVFWRWLCFSYRCCYHRKRLAAGGESVCLLLTRVAIKQKCTASPGYSAPGRSNSHSLLLNIFSCFFSPSYWFTTIAHISELSFSSVMYFSFYS